MSCHRDEPTLSEILSDSVTRALMRADGIERSELEAMLTGIGQSLASDDASKRSPGTRCP